MARLVGVDVGGTNLRIGLFDGLQLVHEVRSHADFAGLCRMHSAALAWPRIIAHISAALQPALTVYSDVAAVGIGFPGFIDPVTGKVALSPNLPGLCNVDLARDLAQAIGYPVIIENDALAAAYGEYRLAENSSSNLIYIGLGTGVGGGLVWAGQPFTGQHGVAMEVGHLIVEAGGRLCGCGNRGCMEQYASASGVSLSYKAASGLDADASVVAQRALAGDVAAIQAYTLAGSSLAQALAHIIKTVDIGQVIIGGGMSGAWPLLQDAFHGRLQADLIPALRDKVDIRLSTSGDQAGMIGAALLAGVRSGN